METNNNDIDKLFRDTLDGHSSTYVSGAWERMENMLNDGNKGIMKENIHRYVLSSIVGTIVLAGSVIAYISGYNASTGTFAENSNATPAQQQEQTITTESNNTPATAQTETAAATENINAQANNNTATATQTTVATTAGKRTKRNTTATQTTNGGGTATTGITSVEEVPAPKEDNIVVAETSPEEPVIAETATEEQPEMLEEATGEKRTYTATTLGIKPLQIGIGTFDNSILDTETAKSNETFTNGQQEQKRQADRRNLLKLNYGLVIGSNFNRVLSNTGANGWGSGIMAGIYFSKNFPTMPRWGLSIGAHYMQSTGNSIGRTITQTTYFFEKTTTQYYLLTKSFQYVQMPINVSYTAGLNHRFNAGIVASYMVNSQTDVAKKTEKTGEFVSNTQTEKGVYEDMNRFGLGLMAGYEYKLPGIYSIGVRYQQQLNDVTSNKFFNDTKKHLPSSIQVYLKLNLTR